MIAQQDILTYFRKFLYAIYRRQSCIILRIADSSFYLTDFVIGTGQTLL